METCTNCIARVEISSNPVTDHVANQQRFQGTEQSWSSKQIHRQSTRVAGLLV